MLRWYTTVVDAVDPPQLATFWRHALGWDLAYEHSDEVAIEAADDTDDRVPAILFVRGAEVKTAKNRLHFDLRPDDQDAEVNRLVRLGARRVDIGQRDVAWVVLADPEGNEFCVLPSQDP